MKIRVGSIRSDNAGEYVSKTMNDFLFSSKIDRELSVPLSSPQNGVAERHIQRLTVMVRHALLSQRLPFKFWGAAFKYAAHVSWLLPSMANPSSQSPWQVATGHLPSIDHLRVFGCRCWSFLTLPERSKTNSKVSPKLLPAAEVCRFVGPAEHSKGWLVWSDRRQCFLTRRHVIFDERPLINSRGTIANRAPHPLKSVKRNPDDPHITARHRKFVGKLFVRKCTDGMGGNWERLGKRWKSG